MFLLQILIVSGSTENFVEIYVKVCCKSENWSWEKNWSERIGKRKAVVSLIAVANSNKIKNADTDIFSIQI